MPASAASRRSRRIPPTHSASALKSSSASCIASLSRSLLLHANREPDWLSVFLQVPRQLKALVKLLIFKRPTTKRVLDIAQLLRPAPHTRDPRQQHRHPRL